jgi:TetR/AcrR family transcriptional regulator, transcriptional repressor for nem operon
LGSVSTTIYRPRAIWARHYREDAKAAFEGFWAETPDPQLCLRKYTDVFRLALENNNRMCLCGFMAAEYDGEKPSRYL